MIQKAIISTGPFSINSDSEDWYTRKKQAPLWSQSQKCRLRRKTNEIVSFAVPVLAVIRAQQDWSALLPSPVIKARPPSIRLELRGTQTRVCKGTEEKAASREKRVIGLFGSSFLCLSSAPGLWPIYLWTVAERGLLSHSPSPSAVLLL